MQSVKFKLLEPEVMILFSLYKKRKRIYDLAISLPWARSTIYYNVRKLQAEGLVVEKDEYIELTEKGKALIDMVRKMICEG